MALIAIGILFAATILTTTELVRLARTRHELEFGLVAVACIAYWDTVSLVTGFSIGWLLSILNTLRGLTLASVTRLYRRQILFVTLISFLLTLFLRGHFPPSLYFLIGLLGATALWAIWSASYSWNHTNEVPSSALVVIVSCLSSIALIGSSYFQHTAMLLAFSATGLSIFSYTVSKQYRLSLCIVGSLSFLWAVTLYRG